MNKKTCFLVPLAILSSLSITSLAIAADNNEYINVTNSIKVTEGPLRGRTVDLQVLGADATDQQETFFVNNDNTVNNIYMLHDNPPTVLDTYAAYHAYVKGESVDNLVPGSKNYYNKDLLPCNVKVTLQYNPISEKYSIIANCS